jgi:RNA polymerase sigma-70 factor (ECF subfamily)
MGPQARFEQLYRAHAGRVLAYVLRRTAAAGADDVVADVFLVAWRRLDDVPEDPLPWLLGVARRVLANRRRGEGRASALHDRLALEHRDRAGGAGDLDERVIRALGRLGARDRELLMLTAWDGLDLADVARVLRARKGTVAVRLHRARQQFAAALAAQDATAPTTMEVPR